MRARTASAPAGAVTNTPPPPKSCLCVCLLGAQFKDVPSFVPAGNYRDAVLGVTW